MIVQTYHRMRAEVNPENPNFEGYTGIRKKNAERWAVVTNGVKTWRELFKIASDYSAEEQVKEVLQFFNDTRRPEMKEKERIFVGFYEEPEHVAKWADDEGMSGWLDPEGVFYPCAFGEHTSYAVQLFDRENRDVWTSGRDEMRNLTLNQHIPMSTWESSSQGYIAILGDLTEKQVDWFNQFFFKLCPRTQRGVVADKAQEQGIKLKFDW